VELFFYRRLCAIALPSAHILEEAADSTGSLHSAAAFDVCPLGAANFVDKQIQRVFVFVGSDTLPGSGLRDLAAMYDAPPNEDILANVVRQRTADLPKRRWFSRAHRIDWVSMLIVCEGSYSTNHWQVMPGKSVASLVRYDGGRCKLPWQDSEDLWHGVVLSAVGYPDALRTTA
jgi:hypothetical protein